MPREVKLSTKDGPWLCEDCGRQRIGLILTILDKTVLPCLCKKEKKDKKEV